MFTDKIAGGPGSGVEYDNTAEIQRLEKSPLITIHYRKDVKHQRNPSRRKEIRLDNIDYGAQNKYNVQKLSAIMDSYEDWKNEPIEVARVDGEYHLLDGHHRFLAADRLGKNTLPAKVWIMTENEVRQLVGQRKRASKKEDFIDAQNDEREEGFDASAINAMSAIGGGALGVATPFANSSRMSKTLPALSAASFAAGPIYNYMTSDEEKEASKEKTESDNLEEGDKVYSNTNNETLSIKSIRGDTLKVSDGEVTWKEPIDVARFKRRKGHWEEKEAGANVFRRPFMKTAEGRLSEIEKEDLMVGGGGAATIGGAKLVGNSKSDVTGRETLYHGTDADSAESIRRSGLKPSSPDMETPNLDAIEAREDAYEKSMGKTYLSPKKQQALRYAQQTAEGGKAKGGMAGPISQISEIFNDGEVVKTNVPVWKKSITRVENPETAGITREEAPEELLRDPDRALGIQRQQAKQTYDSLQRTRVFDHEIPTKYIKGSDNYERLSPSEVMEYARKNPASFGKGVGKAGAGLGLLGAGGYGVYEGLDRKGVLPVEKNAMDKEGAKNLSDLEQDGDWVKYRGEWYPLDNPVKSWRKGKKRAVLASKEEDGGKKVKLIHYGSEDHEHNYSEQAKRNYLSRAKGITNSKGEKTKDDPHSANHWAIKDLWPEDQEADGGEKFDAYMPGDNSRFNKTADETTKNQARNINLDSNEQIAAGTALGGAGAGLYGQFADRNNNFDLVTDQGRRQLREFGQVGDIEDSREMMAEYGRRGSDILGGEEFINPLTGGRRKGKDMVRPLNSPLTRNFSNEVNNLDQRVENLRRQVDDDAEKTDNFLRRFRDKVDYDLGSTSPRSHYEEFAKGPIDGLVQYYGESKSNPASGSLSEALVNSRLKAAEGVNNADEFLQNYATELQDYFADQEGTNMSDAEAQEMAREAEKAVEESANNYNEGDVVNRGDLTKEELSRQAEAVQKNVLGEDYDQIDAREAKIRNMIGKAQELGYDISSAGELGGLSDEKQMEILRADANPSRNFFQHFTDAQMAGRAGEAAKEYEGELGSKLDVARRNSDLLAKGLKRGGGLALLGGAAAIPAMRYMEQQEKNAADSNNKIASNIPTIHMNDPLFSKRAKGLPDDLTSGIKAPDTKLDFDTGEIGEDLSFDFDMPDLKMPDEANIEIPERSFSTTPSVDANQPNLGSSDSPEMPEVSQNPAKE